MKLSLIKKVFGVAAFAAALSFVGCAGYGGGDSSGSPADTSKGGTTGKRITPDAPEGPGPISMSSGSGSLGRAAGGDSYNSIADALEAIPATGTETYVITLGPGTYKENGLSYNGSCTVKIVGTGTKDYGADVVIVGKGKDQLTTKTRPLLEIQGSGDVILQNIMLKNNFVRDGSTNNTQAEAFGHDSTGNVIAVNCAFLSHQDTVRTVSKAWFYGCYIEGDVDFLWCEASSIVALYENCSIRALNEESKSAYVAAPKFDAGSKVGKGLVVLNSTVVLEDDLDAYLFRNPWSGSTGYYNSVAYVNTTVEGTVSSKGLAKSAALGTTDQQYVGYKVDSTLANKFSSKMSNVSVLSDAIKNVEYNGREAILNRKVNTATLKFAKDSETYWDISSVIEKNSFTVVTDTSKSLLDGETESVTKIYMFDSDTVPDGISATGFANEAGKTHYVGAAGNTIEVPLTGKALVEVTGYYKGNGTIKAGSQGEVLYDFNNGSTSRTVTKPYIVYDANATKCVITASATTYITKIVVTYDDTLEFNPVTSITVNSADDAMSVASKKTLQFSAVISPDSPTNPDVVWSISAGASVASIDQTGLLTAGSAAADTSVTVRCTSKDANAVFGEKTITVKQLQANAFDVSWLDSETHVASPYGATSGNTDIAVGANAVPAITTNASAWVMNSSKLTSCPADYGLTATVATASSTTGAFYIDFPLTAVKNLNISSVTVTYGAHGTNNPRGVISYSKDNGSTWTQIAKDTETQQNKKVIYTADINLSENEKVIIRVDLDGSIATGKSPTIGTVVVSGEAVTE